MNGNKIIIQGTYAKHMPTKSELINGILRALLYLAAIIIIGYVAYNADLNRERYIHGAEMTGYLAASIISGVLLLKRWISLKFSIIFWGGILAMPLNIVCYVFKIALFSVVGTVATPIFIVWALIVIIRNTFFIIKQRKDSTPIIEC